MSVAPQTRGNLALARPQRPAAPQAPAPRRHLEIAPARAQRRARPRVAHVVVTLGGIGVILLVQLLLSFVLADGAYEIATLQSEQRDLLREEQALDERIELLGSTQNLTANAEALGMVASGNPIFLNLATGGVSGVGGRSGSLPENLIPNALLDGTTVIDPALLQQARDAETGSGDTGQSTLGGVTTTGTPGTLPSPETH